MDTLSTQEAVAYLKARGIKLSSTQVAQIAKAGIFPNAEKDSQNRWRISEEDLENYITKSKKDRRRNWITASSIVATLTILASVFAILSGSIDFVDFISNYVFPKRDIPIVVVTNAELGFQIVSPKDKFVICRSTIEIANTSSVPTSVTGIGTELHMDSVIISFEPTKIA